MSGFGALTSALLQPDAFERGSLQIPGIGGITSGPDASADGMLDAFSLDSVLSGTSMSKFFNKNVEGGNFMSNKSTTQKVAVARGTTRGDVYQDAIVFTGPGTPMRLTAHETYPVKSLFTLNAFLKSEAGRRKYGGCTTYHKLLDDWRYAGVVRVPPANWQDTNYTEQVITLIVQGEALIKDIFQAQASAPRNRKANGMVNEGDYVFLCYIRCKLDDALTEAVQNAESEANGEAGQLMQDAMNLEAENPSQGGAAIPKYYWKILPTTTFNRSSPPLEWYTNDSAGPDWYLGYCQKIAMVTMVSGRREVRRDRMYAARRAIAGDEDWMTLLNMLQKVKINLMLS